MTKIDANPPRSKSLNIRIDPGLFDVLAAKAAFEDRTISSLVRRWLSATATGDLVGVVDPRSFPVPVEATPFDGGRR